jgi:hypothetical protein
VLDITKTKLFDYCGSPDFHDDLETGLSHVEKSGTAAQVNHGELTALEFHKDIKHDKG